MGEKRAPVQGFHGGIPWWLHLEAYDAYCKKWGPQPALIDLEGRNCRGGFATEELDVFVPGWRDTISHTTAVEKQRDEALARIAVLEAVLRECERRLNTCAMAFEGISIRTGDNYGGFIESTRTLAAKITTTLAAVPMTGETK